MRWIDLSAYGVVLKVNNRVLAVPVVHVMENGDNIAEALLAAGFSRRTSGLWFRKFEAGQCVSMLTSLMSRLDRAAIRDFHPDAVLELPAAPRPSSSSPSKLPAQARTAPDAAAASNFDAAVAQLQGIAAPVDMRPRARSAPPLRSRTPAAPASVTRRAPLPAPVPAERTPRAAIDFVWAVSTGADDARAISGLGSLVDRNYVVARLSFADDRDLAIDSIGADVSFGPDYAHSMLVIAVLEAADGVGFGGAGDVLVLGESETMRGASVSAGARAEARAA